MTDNTGSVDNELIRYLNYCIDIELKKSESEMDSSLIDKYSVIIDHLENHRYNPDPKIKQKQIKELIKLYRQNKIAGVKRMLGKIAAAVLVFVGVAVGTLLTASAVTGMSPAELFQVLGGKILGYSYKENIRIKDVILYKSGNIVEYSSLSELLERENLEILYPTWLPQDVYVESVLIIESPDGKEVVFEFNSSITYTIKFYKYYEMSTYNDTIYTKRIINGIPILYNYNGTTHVALFEISGNSYYITTTAYEILHEFVLGLKK